MTFLRPTEIIISLLRDVLLSFLLENANVRFYGMSAAKKATFYFVLSARETMQKTLALKFISSFEISTHFSNKFD